MYGELVEKKVLNKERESMLRMFLFGADLIIHESGIPPIHTSIDVLNDLPTNVKKKMLIVHCSAIPATGTNQPITNLPQLTYLN
jgi:hypothetical protein